MSPYTPTPTTAQEAASWLRLRWALPPYPHPTRGPVPWREAPGNWHHRVDGPRAKGLGIEGKAHGLPWPWGWAPVPGPAKGLGKPWWQACSRARGHRKVGDEDWLREPWPWDGTYRWVCAK